MKKFLSLTSVDYMSHHKCLIPGKCNVTTTKAAYFGFYYLFLISLWACFAKKCNVPLWMLMNLDRKEKRKSKKTVFHVIITSTFFFLIFIQFFLYLLLHQKNKFCCEFIWNTSVKKTATTNKPTKQNESSQFGLFLQHYLADYPTVIYLFVFFLHLECR